jgi:hypothetical protein
VYVGLGQRDQALEWLRTAYSEKFNPSVLLRQGFDPQRSDPRLRDLLHKIGLKD